MFVKWQVGTKHWTSATQNLRFVLLSADNSTPGEGTVRLICLVTWIPKGTQNKTNSKITPKIRFLMI